jgi:putative peptide zinc metalloprotease protein
LLVVLFLPLPNSVVCTLEIQARDAEPVYVDVAGTLDSLDVRPGQQVAKGQQLAQLHSTDVDLEIAKLVGKADEYRMQLEALRQQIARNYRAADQIPQLKEALKTVQDQLQEKTRDRQRLRLMAPAAGTVLPPPVTSHHEDTDEKLPTWAGTPLDRENLGSLLERDVLFCQVGDPKRLEAVMVIDQADRNIVRDGQSVDLRLEGFPSDTLHGEIAEIAESELKISPQRLSNKSGGELATKTDPHTGAEKPMSTSYQARVPIDDPAGLFRLGIRGQARIYTDWLPLGTRLWRLLSHTFNFKL